MLSVPRRANDAMYVNMLHGIDVSTIACPNRFRVSAKRYGYHTATIR